MIIQHQLPVVVASEPTSLRGYARKVLCMFVVGFDISVLACYVEDDVIEEWRASTDNRRDLKDSSSFVDSTSIGDAIGATMA